MFTDRASGTLDNRKELAKVLDQRRPGDTLVVWRLDRLGRSLRHLIETVTALAERKIGFRSLTENINTTTAAESSCSTSSAPSPSSNATSSATAPWPVSPRHEPEDESAAVR